MQVLQARRTWKGGEGEGGELPARHLEGQQRPQSERERLSPKPLRWANSWNRGQRRGIHGLAFCGMMAAHRGLFI